MRISTEQSHQPIGSDLEQIAKVLPIAPGETLLELGCGKAQTTRALATQFPRLKIIATEVDQIQHQKNLEQDDLDNVTFLYGGAEKIGLPDDSVNYVVMLKSLHHVPLEAMEASLRELARVLVPGGWAYISEPVFAGPFNDILRLFHDEEIVRRAAFDAICKAIDGQQFELVEQIFFAGPRKFNGFGDFEELIIGVTHTEFQIDEALLQKIKTAFDRHLDTDGNVHFNSPLRVDLLRTPTATQQ